MNIKRILYFASPKLTSRILAAVIAVLMTLATFKVANAFIVKEEEPPEGETDGEQAVQTGEQSVQEEKKDTFNCENAIAVGTVVNGKSAFLCELNSNTAVAEKNMLGSVSIKDASVFMVALTVSNAVSEGKVALTDEAVCPASAAKDPNYSLSEEVLPIGKRMKIGDILKCMLYQSGSSYAYTLAVHISGSETAFVNEMNELAKTLKLNDTLFTSCTGNESLGGTVSAYDLAVIIKYVLADPLLKGIICSDDMITVGYGQSGSIELVVKNDFFENYCTEKQASTDGIIGGKVSSATYSRWSVVIFSNGGKEYLSIILESNDAFADSLMLYTAYVLSVADG